MKKRMLSVFLAVLTLICLFSLTAFAAGKGDVDGDGKITAADARLALRQSVGLEALSDEECITADMDSDGKISAADARTILRISVGLDTVPSQNEYEIMRSGTFYMTAYMSTEYGYYDYSELAVDGNNAYMSASFDMMEMAMLIKDGELYMINDEKEAVLQLSEAVLQVIGMSKEELIPENAFDFSSYAPLEQLKIEGTEEFQGKSCTVYSSENEVEKTLVYMCGDEVERLMSYSPDGVLLAEIIVESISADVPEGCMNIPSSYKLYKGLNGMFSFISLFEF